jgi:phosphinothricin acetyltransferase
MSGIVTVRPARETDAPALCAIYAPYAEETAVSFEYAAPDEETFLGRMRTVMRRYPYLTAEADGEIVGYAYAGPFGGREAYGWSAEVTVYVRQDRRRSGAGRALYRALEACLRAQGVVNLYACVAVPAGPDPRLTEDSLRFHEHMGYREVGRFRGCGYKFGRWYDMVWLEKSVGARGAAQPPVRAFGEVKGDVFPD